MTRNWRLRWGEISSARMICDIGTTSLTGVRASVLSADAKPEIAHAVYQTAALSAAECAGLGSDFQRVGFVHAARDPGIEEFTDVYGVGWLVAYQFPAPFLHPLENADWDDIPRHPKPVLPARMQLAETGRPDLLTVLDPPCPGLLDTCFALRNSWQFLDDLTGNWQKASALLDWAMETTVASYQAAVAALPQEPDLIVYGDDLGFQSGMYLSDVDFRNFLYPRMQTFLSRLRRMSNAPICLHSCGAIRSIVRDLAALDVDMLNLDFFAKGMLLNEVRKEMPTSVILHAPVNLAAIGRAVLDNNRATLALLATELASSMPAIAAPVDNITSADDLAANFYGIAFVRALDADQLKTLRDVGAVRSIIDHARSTALEAGLPPIAQEQIQVGLFVQSAARQVQPDPAQASSLGRIA